ncbi:hypothetical protein [Asaia bogorensis]|uniref:hypothetical protein n=1 Tax=Asaia bogorensis TaxID=91915 RepID=UPI002860228D|nr:hypothetical protein [Asaia bogorensis]MDR6182949.1 hypothetical protein [Asaia bogorensis NBRC 16594]
MDVEIFGRKVWIHGIQGRVSGLRSWTETHTTTSGGQVRDCGPGGLQVDAPRVNVHTTHHQSFWVISPSGREWQGKGNYPLREGQEVRVLWAGLGGQTTTGHVVMHNRTLQKLWTNPQDLPRALSFHGIKRLTLKYLAVMALVFGFFLFLTLSINEASRNDTYNRDPGTAFFFIGLLACLVLVAIGALHRVRMIRDNQSEALSVIQKAVANNPKLQESLSA